MSRLFLRFNCKTESTPGKQIIDFEDVGKTKRKLLKKAS